MKECRLNGGIKNQKQKKTEKKGGVNQKEYL